MFLTQWTSYIASSNKGMFTISWTACLDYNTVCHGRVLELKRSKMIRALGLGRSGTADRELKLYFAKITTVTFSYCIKPCVPLRK